MGRSHRTAIILIGLGLTAAACNEALVNPPAGKTATLRLLHASAATGPVDVLIGSNRVISSVAFGSQSVIAPVPAGPQQLVIRSGSQVIAQLSGTLSTGHLNTVVVSSGSAHLSEVVAIDTGAVDPTRANVRLVNVAGANHSDPTLLQAVLTATNQAGQAPDSVQRFNFDAKVSRYGSLMYLSPGQITVKFVAQGSPTELARVTFPVAAGQARAVVLERAANGSYSAEVVIER